MVPFFSLRRMVGQIKRGHSFAWASACSAGLIAGLCCCDTTSAKDPATKQPVPRVAKKNDDTRIGGAKSIDKHPLQEALKIAHSSEESLQSIQDYSATFIKQERVKGKLIQQNLELKFREQPFSVYLKFIKPHAGREVLYVANQNQGKLLAHEEGLIGLVGTVGFAPTSSEAMDENRHPITEIGMKKMLGHVIRQWESDLQSPDVTVQYFPKAKVGQTDALMIETTQPKQPQFKFHITRLYLDKKTNLPIRVEQFGWPEKAGEQPPLMEEYTYTDLKTNSGLGDIDFSTKNTAYRF